MGLSDRRISSPAFRGLVLKTFTSLATVVCVLAASPAAALPIVPVASRVALAGNDTLVWAGADGAALGSPHVQASVGGLNVAAFATAPALDLFLFIQNGSAFTANFTSGDRLLTTGFDDGPLTLSFATPIRGIGFNIVNQNFGMFTGTMQFLDLMNNSLGTVSVMGTSSAANDGSAPFLGGVGNLLEISSVIISVSAVGGGIPLAINHLSLVTTPVPEPAAALMLLLGLAGVALHRRRARSQPN